MPTERHKIIPFPSPDPDAEPGPATTKDPLDEARDYLLATMAYQLIPPTPPPHDAEPDPVEELKKVGRHFKAETGLNADEAAEYIMAKVRHRPLSDALAAKVAGTRLDPEARTFSLRYKLTEEDGGWVAEDLEGLDFLGYEPDGSAESAVWSMLCELSFAFREYGMAPDAGLVESARELKRRLLAKFGLVAEEDKEEQG